MAGAASPESMLYRTTSAAERSLPASARGERTEGQVTYSPTAMQAKVEAKITLRFFDDT